MQGHQVARQQWGELQQANSLVSHRPLKILSCDQLSSCDQSRPETNCLPSLFSGNEGSWKLSQTGSATATEQILSLECDAVLAISSLMFVPAFAIVSNARACSVNLELSHHSANYVYS